MTPKEVAEYYARLSNGDKGRFTAYLSLILGGSPHTWQHKILCWSKNKAGRPVSPVIGRELTSIVKDGRWRFQEVSCQQNNDAT